MKRIAIYGLTEKRPVIYGLLCALGAFGKTLIVTPNRQYMRLTDGYVNYGYFCDDTILVTDMSPEEVEASIEDLNIYDFIIYDLYNYDIDNADISLMVAGSNLTEAELDQLSILPSDTEIIKIAYDGKTFRERSVTNKATTVFIDPTMLATIEYIERFHSYRLFNNKQLLQWLEGYVADLMNARPAAVKAHFNKIKKRKVM